jgi:hypothetical protein
MAFAHVDDAVGRFCIEAEQGLATTPLGTEGGATATVRRRDVGRPDSRLAYALRGQGGSNAIPEKVGECSVVEMLELAAAAFGKVAAWWHLPVRAGLEAAVLEQEITGRGERHVPAGRSHAVATRRDADDRFA